MAMGRTVKVYKEGSDGLLDDDVDDLLAYCLLHLIYSTVDTGHQASGRSLTYTR